VKRLTGLEPLLWLVVSIYFLVASLGYIGNGEAGDAFHSTLVAVLAFALMGKSLPAADTTGGDE
jgi:hypothetical protein